MKRVDYSGFPPEVQTLARRGERALKVAAQAVVGSLLGLTVKETVLHHDGQGRCTFSGANMPVGSDPVKAMTCFAGGAFLERLRGSTRGWGEMFDSDPGLIFAVRALAARLEERGKIGGAEVSEIVDEHCDQESVDALEKHIHTASSLSTRGNYIPKMPPNLHGG